jgi:Arc/MetJ-type ribon-helix-helix transcriptional regulator
MKRTTITLSEDLAAAVEREAHRRRTSVSEVVRAALAAHFRLDQPRRLPFESLGGSGYRNTARDMEEVLAREWGDAIDRDR